jgi:hypothetical protein
MATAILTFSTFLPNWVYLNLKMNRFIACLNFYPGSDPLSMAFLSILQQI